MSPKTGRPPVENPKSERLYIRIEAAEKKKIMDFCKANCVTCLDLIRKGMEAIK